MKKILFVIDNLNVGGVEKSLISLLNYIDIQQYKVDILPLVSKGILAKELASKNISIINTPHSKFDTKILSNSFKETVIGYIKRMSIVNIFKVIYLFIKGKFNPMIRKLKISELVRCSIIDSFDCNKIQYDLAIGYIDRQYSYYVIKKVKSKKKVMWIHSDYNAVDNSIKAYYNCYKQFDSIICVSNKARLSFLKKFPALYDRIDVISNVLDTKKMDMAIPYDFRTENIKMVSVGRLSPEKRFLTLVDNFHKIDLMTNKKIILYIIGDGPEYGLIKKKIKEYELVDKIILLGEQDNPYQFIKSADIFLQPSINEGYCLTVYEALYLQKFVIAFDVADIKNVIKNGKNGFICKDDNDFIIKAVNTIEKELYKKSFYSVFDYCNVNVLKKITKLFGKSR